MPNGARGVGAGGWVRGLATASVPRGGDQGARHLIPRFWFLCALYVFWMRLFGRNSNFCSFDGPRPVREILSELKNESNRVIWSRQLLA